MDFLVNLTFLTLQVGTSVWASASQMTSVPFPSLSLPIYTLWSGLTPSPPLKVLPLLSPDVGVLQLSHGLPAFVNVFSVGLHSSNFFPDSRPLPLQISFPPLVRLSLVSGPLAVNIGLCLLVLRRTEASVHEPLSLPRCPCLDMCTAGCKQRSFLLSGASLHLCFWSHGLVYGAFLCP